MANREEKTGGPPPPALTGHPTTRRRTVTPPPPRVGATRTRTGNSNYSKNSGQNYTRAVNRRAATSSRTPSAPARPNSKVIVPTAPPKPVAPDLNKFLAGDSTYQRQLAAYNKSLADFGADQGLARSDYTTNYNNASRDIGLAKTEAAGNLEDDYASRGLLKSGLYNTALGELNTQYQNQSNDLNAQQTAFLAGLAQELNKYKTDQGVQKGNAYNEAVRRRAEQYNL